MNIFQKVFHWYFTKQALPYWVILVLDCVIVFLASIMIYVVKLGITDIWKEPADFFFWMFVFVLCYIPGFRIMHTYSGVLRYSSFVDLQRVGFANFIGFAISGIAAFAFRMSLPGVHSVRSLIAVYLLSTGAMWALRIGVKYMYDIAYYSNQAKRVFIYGTHSGGVSLAKGIRNAEKSRYILDGFVSADEDQADANTWLLGEKVYRNDELLLERMRQRRVSTLIVSPQYTLALIQNQTLVDGLIAAGIHIMIMPQSFEWDGKEDLNYRSMHEVEIEDLLPRDKIEVDMDKIGELLTGKRIMITGAAGSIGSEMVRQVAIYKPAELVLIDQAETPLHDIRLMMAHEFPNVKAETIVTTICNQTRMEKLFMKYQPEYVFHAAAYKHVPMMEDNPSESVQNNVYGSRVLADLAVKYGTKKFVMVSTDKAVNPTNVMGCSKRICEIYVQSLNKAIMDGEIKGVTRFITTRFGNVLGSNGSVIPLFREQLKHGGPLTVTHPDIVRYFMLIPEACRLVLQAGTMGEGGEIFVFDMGQPVRIADLAQRMINLSGARSVKIEYTGLRDGEKLYEELLNDKELTKPSMHPKIKVAKVSEYDYAEAKKNEDRLYEASFAYDDMETVRIMKEIVPEFRSQHSKYEALDLNVPLKKKA